MTLEEFTSSIQGKFFVELSGEAVSSFTGLGADGVALRNAATEAGVLVFLTDIKKIYARNFYYGIDPEDWSDLESRVGDIEDTITSMGTPLQNLAGLVATNGQNINNLITLIGASTLPAETNDIITRIANLEEEISSITGDNSLSEVIEDLVDSRLDSVLNTRIGDYLSENDYIQQDSENPYIQQSDLTSLNTTIGQSIQTLSDAIALKAAQSDFSALVGLVGASSLNDVNWGNQETIVTVVNNLKSSTQTLSVDLNDLSSDVSTLSNTVSGIPKFYIEVVQELPQSNISRSTIYLVAPAEGADPEDNELFTEYIYVNKNAGKKDPETGADLPELMAWEKLGRQFFKIDNYLDEEAIKEITDPLVEYIDKISSTINENTAAQISTNTTNIGNLQTSVGNLESALSGIQTKLASLIDNNGDLVFTGEDILTTASGNTTIAEDISDLNTNKLDADTLRWVIINEETI